MRGGFGGGPLSLLQREDVQQELRMTTAQVGDVEELNETARTGMREQMGRMGDFRNMSNDERQSMFEEMREAREKQQEELRDKAKGILNRNQLARFAELEFQFALQRGDLMGALTAAGVELEPSDEEKLRDAQQEAQAELQEKMAELRREANMEALETVVDRARIERLAGEPFTFEAMGGPGFGRPGGGPPQAQDRGRAAGRERPATRGRTTEEGSDRRGRRSTRER
jgi:hypothetical protein